MQRVAVYVVGEGALCCFSVTSRLSRRLSPRPAEATTAVRDGHLHGPECGTLKGATEEPMRLKEDIKPVTYMKTRPAELLKKVSESGRPTIITQNGEAKAVLMDVESYEALRDAATLLQLAAQGEKDIQEGRYLPQEEAFARVRSRIQKK